MMRVHQSGAPGYPGPGTRLFPAPKVSGDPPAHESKVSPPLSVPLMRLHHPVAEGCICIQALSDPRPGIDSAAKRPPAALPGGFLAPDGRRGDGFPPTRMEPDKARSIPPGRNPPRTSSLCSAPTRRGDRASRRGAPPPGPGWSRLRRTSTSARPRDPARPRARNPLRRERSRGGSARRGRARRALTRLIVTPLFAPFFFVPSRFEERN